MPSPFCLTRSISTQAIHLQLPAVKISSISIQGCMMAFVLFRKQERMILQLPSLCGLTGKKMADVLVLLYLSPHLRVRRKQTRPSLNTNTQRSTANDAFRLPASRWRLPFPTAFRQRGKVNVKTNVEMIQTYASVFSISFGTLPGFPLIILSLHLQRKFASRGCIDLS